MYQKYAGHWQRNMLCIPPPGLENDTSSSSKTHTWWGTEWTGQDQHLSYTLPGMEFIDLEKAPEAPDGSKFVEQLASKDSTGHAVFVLMGSHFSRLLRLQLRLSCKLCSGYNFEA